VKFAIIAFVVCLCEFIGRRNQRAARSLILSSVLLTCVPIFVAVFETAFVVE